jgi:hypothetical protein
MTNNRSSFKFLDEEERVPVGSKWIKCHMIFNVKMNFTRKARFVAGGHMTDPPSTITYSSVVSRDSIRIAFMLASLNGLSLCATDIGNAYLNAEAREKVYTTAGPEFGAELEGHYVSIVRALYGLKSSGVAWRAHLANTLQSLGYTSCLADPDVWMKPAMKPCGFEYYEYVLVYVDDVLVLSHQPEITMRSLAQYYRLKDRFAEPTRYLGAEVKKWVFPEDNSKFYWALSSSQYVQEAVKNVEEYLSAYNQTLRKSNQPFPTEYRPELDTSPLLEDDAIHYYQSQLSILRWMVELGRLDIYVNVAMLSPFLMQPREGHLKAIFSIYGYLKFHTRSTMVFDDSYIQWNNDLFPTHDWTDFYNGATEDIPKNAPQPRGLPAQVNVFVDANHAGNRLTCRSQTGILLYLNKAPTMWYSKLQKTVETSTFGSEFVAMRVATEIIKGLRYKLRMMGVPLDGPANVLADNETMIKNSTIPSQT